MVFNVCFFGFNLDKGSIAFGDGTTKLEVMPTCGLCLLFESK